MFSIYHSPLKGRIKFFPLYLPHQYSDKFYINLTPLICSGPACYRHPDILPRNTIKSDYINVSKTWVKNMATKGAHLLIQNQKTPISPFKKCHTNVLRLRKQQLMIKSST